jgi:outer membrane protein assembly factor BamB
VPFLDEETEKWTQSTIRQEQTRQWVDQAIKFQQERRRQPVLPAFFPIATAIGPEKNRRPLVIFRSFFGVHAVDITTGKLVWEQDADFSVDNLVNAQRSGGKLVQLNQWLPMYQQAGQLNLLYENSTLGSLSTDGKLVYYVDDLALPPHPQFLMNFMWGGKPNLGPLTDVAGSSKLLATSLESGKRVWQAGGFGEKGGALADSFFLGAPLPLEGRLYVLNEKNSELSLVCLNPKDGKPIWSQRLGAAGTPLAKDTYRRMQAASLAYADGIMVCPTNIGIVFGVDIVQRRLAWAHSYSLPPANQPAAPNQPAMRRWQMMLDAARTPQWRYCGACIEDGKVVFTAPDSDGVECLNLRDGTLAWKVARRDDVYLAGIFKGKAVLVGKSACRALSLTDGKQLWQVETGMPSGLGAATGSRYLLPIQSRAGGDTPEICVIDLDKGEVHSRVSSRQREIVGNLLLFEGQVMSQTVRGITGYPELRTKLKEVEGRLKKNAKDPAGLLGRGEMRYASGELRGAAEDLVAALAEKPADEIREHARAKLYDVLTDLLRRDFAAGEKYLAHYRDASEVPIPDNALDDVRKSLVAEQQKRRATYFGILAAGRERQGKFEEALENYLEFSKLPTGDGGMLAVPDDANLRASPAVWASARIIAMTARIAPEKRKTIDDMITRRWETVRAGKNLDDVRAFVAIFGAVPKLGSEARMELASRLMDQRAWLEAEMHLLQLREAEPTVAARAVDMLGQLMMRADRLESAGHWYRTLNRDFAKVVVRDGKTGADVFNRLAEDKRLLPYLEAPQSRWRGKLKVSEEFGQFAQVQQQYYFEPEGNVLPPFKRQRLSFTINTSQLKLLDRLTGEELWSQGLQRQSPQYLQYLNWNQYNPNQRPIKFSYFVQGHIAVLPLGLRAYAFDLMDRKILWEQSLATANLPVTQVLPGPEGRLNVVHPDGHTEPIDSVRFFAPNLVVLQSRNQLAALDPIRGTILWERNNVPATTRVLGDAGHLYLIDVRADGGIGRGTAIRARDGAAVEVPDFSEAFKKQNRIVGRDLLIAEDGPKGEKTLRLYDVRAGKDRWKKEFSKEALVLDSEVPNVVGVVEPNDAGKLTIFDARSQKELLTSKIDPKWLKKVRGITLLADRDYFYVATNEEPNPKLNPWGGPWPNLVNGSRGVRVDGVLYAFPRQADGKAKRWWCEVGDQVLVLDQYQDLPILLFTCRSQQLMNGGVFQMTRTMSIEKSTGKVLYDKQSQNNNTNFHTLSIDSRAGTMDLIGYNIKIRHSAK